MLPDLLLARCACTHITMWVMAWFWLTVVLLSCSNPYNWLTNNAASGGASGFVYVHLDAPIGVRPRNAAVTRERRSSARVVTVISLCDATGCCPKLSRSATLPGGAPLVPHQRPVGLFEGNTAHSSGYHWGEAAAVYAGGDLGYDDDNKTLVYTIERHTFDPRCAEAMFT